MSKGIIMSLYICHHSYDAQINVRNVQITRFRDARINILLLDSIASLMCYIQIMIWRIQNHW